MSIKKLLLLSLVFLTGFAVNSFAQEEDPFVCGSPEEFNKTKHWQDLPGCIELNAEDYDHPARIILSRAKKEYRDFFSEWTRGGEHALSGAVSSYESGIKKIYQNDNWDSDPGLTAAKPSYDEMKRISEEHLALKDSYPLIRELSDTVGTLDSFSISLIQREGKDPDATLFALKNAHAAMIKVVAAGLPDWLIIRYSWKSKSLQSLGEVKADLELTGSIVNKLARSTKAADEAKWKPYTDVLKGDRLKLFKKYEVKHEMATGSVLGPHKVRYTTKDGASKDVTAEHIVIATGARASSRVLASTSSFMSRAKVSPRMFSRSCRVICGNPKPSRRSSGISISMNACRYGAGPPDSAASEA